MGQLIDKTVLRKELSKLPSEMGFVRKPDVMQILGNQKCVYDAEKVVKELDEWTFNANVDIGDGTMMSHNLIVRDNAVDIVRKGGLYESNVSFKNKRKWVIK